jgi:1,4-dihydroxy-2-naphthoate octaprenyltransferase
MNFSMWGQALRIIPRLNKEEWDRLDIISRWLVATRAAVLVMTFISAAIAGILAYRDGAFHLGRWLVLAFGLVLAHATNNLVNDITDHLKGVDRENTFRAQYGPQPLEHELLSLRQMWAYTSVTGLIALAAGLYLVIVRGGLTLPLMALGALFVLFYTYPLKFIGLGEAAVLVVWGPLMIGGGYYVITGVWDWNVTLASLPYALGPTTVIFGKHIDKLAQDRELGIRTLPVLLGERAARYTVMAMMVLQYGLVIYLVAGGFFTLAMLAVLLAVPSLIQALRLFLKPRPQEKPADYPASGWPLWFVAFAFLHNRRYGGLFLLGLLGDALWQRLLL